MWHQIYATVMAQLLTETRRIGEDEETDFCRDADVVIGTVSWDDLPETVGDVGLVAEWFSMEHLGHLEDLGEI
jgi:hypothetical protein